MLLNDQRLARILVASQGSTARQSHGFVFQSGVSRLLGLYVPYNYTDEVDAYSIKQPQDEVMRHSFKTLKAGSAVELGSLARNATTPRDFVLYAASWAEFPTNLREVRVLHIRADYWRALFPSDVSQFEREAAFRDENGEIGNSRDDDSRWEARQAELKREWLNETPVGSPISVAFKRDHKTQRRVQCNVPASRLHDLFRDCYDPHRTIQLEHALDGERVPVV